MLSCKGEERGCFVYYCRHCKVDVIVPFGCNSRLCSSCGKRHTNRWAETLSRRVFPGIIHRHLVLTIPDALWAYIKENRDLQAVIMDASYSAIQELFSSIKHQHLTPGVIAVLHPFGKDLRFKPHAHCIVTEGGFNYAHKFISIGQYIHYNSFHKIWQYHLLTALRGRIPQEIIDYLFKKYPHGFCSYVKPERIYSSKRLAQYLGRYIRHPAISDARIIRYDSESVTFFYKDREEKMHYHIISADDFILAVIQHLPEKNFRLVRYYGAYSSKKIRRFRTQSNTQQTTLMKFVKKRAAYCPYCNKEIEFVAYVDKPPPKDLTKLSTWMDLP